MAKAAADIRSLARKQTGLAIRTLTGICSSSAAPASARVQAAGLLLDRGWGRAVQPHDGEGGNSSIQVIIRQLVEIVEAKPPPLVISHDDDKAG